MPTYDARKLTSDAKDLSAKIAGSTIGVVGCLVIGVIIWWSVRPPFEISATLTVFSQLPRRYHCEFRHRRMATESQTIRSSAVKEKAGVRDSRQSEEKNGVNAVNADGVSQIQEAAVTPPTQGSLKRRRTL